MKRCCLTISLCLLTLGAWAAGSQEETSKPIVAVWYPNNSGEDWKAIRVVFDEMIAKATGRKVVDMLTTDSIIAIEALGQGKAAILYPGAVNFLRVQEKNPKVQPLVVASGNSGTLEDAFYYARIVVKTENAPQYLKNGKYVLDPLKGKTFSFVSTSSTSGFVLPANQLKAALTKTEKFGDAKIEDLFLEGGPDKFFSKVVFGPGHQGSLLNVLSGKADAGAVDDIDVDAYLDLVSGNANIPGAVYAVKQGAAAPFDTVPVGTRFTVLAAIQVKNAPIVVNTALFTPAQLKALRDAFTSDEAASNPKLFLPAGEKGTAFNKQTGKNRFVPVDNSWWDPVREALK